MVNALEENISLSFSFADHISLKQFNNRASDLLNQDFDYCHNVSISVNETDYTATFTFTPNLDFLEQAAKEEICYLAKSCGAEVPSTYQGIM